MFVQGLDPFLNLIHLLNIHSKANFVNCLMKEGGKNVLSQQRGTNVSVKRCVEILLGT